MVRRLGAVLAVAALAGVLAVPALGSGPVVEATSWIDAPLDGIVVPVAPIDVVAHSTDQAIVREVVLEVDGVAVATRTLELPAKMTTSRFRWEPGAAGIHSLVVRARNMTGGWGAPATVRVVVDADAPPLPTAPPAGSPEPGASGSPGPTSGPGTSLPPGSTLPPGATPTPVPRTPPPTPGVTPCPLPGPKLLTPPDDTTYLTVEIPNPVFEWSWNGPDECLDHFVFVLNLDQQIDAYAADGYFREYDLAADTTSYQPPVIFLPDPSEWNGCGFYSWTVRAADPDGNEEQSPQVWTFRVCPPDG